MVVWSFFLFRIHIRVKNLPVRVNNALHVNKEQQNHEHNTKYQKHERRIHRRNTWAARFVDLRSFAYWLLP